MCFERALQGRRDSGFFTFGKLNQYVRKLCYRSLLPTFVPREGDWTCLGNLQTATLRQMSTEDFLIRLNLETKLDAAVKAKGERELGEQKTPRTAKTELAATHKEEFVSRARSYLVSLLEVFLNRLSQPHYRHRQKKWLHLILKFCWAIPWIELSSVFSCCSVVSACVAGRKDLPKLNVRMNTWNFSINSGTPILLRNVRLRGSETSWTYWFQCSNFRAGAISIVYSA